MPARTFRLALSAAALVALHALPAAAQQDGEDWVEQCRRRSRGDDREVHCEERETRLRATGSLRVDGRANGGITVRGWDRDEVLVRARIQASARTEEAARQIAGRIRVRTEGGEVSAEGPDTERREGWAVSYEIFAPRSTDLELRTTNGPIRLENVRGDIGMQAVNGPISLRGVGGDVRGRAQNGPVRVVLDGQRWEGEGLDLETTNGPVTLMVPEGYSARLETGTVNGPMSVDFPVTVSGRLNRRIETELGRGGAPIRVVTTNGPVTLRRP